MLILQVSVQVKSPHLSEFLAAAGTNAAHSVDDEPGCLRFDVIQDREDPTRISFYEVYRDEAALDAHRQTPHFKAYFERVQSWLAAPPERRFGRNLTPSDAAWR